MMGRSMPRCLAWREDGSWRAKARGSGRASALSSDRVASEVVSVPVALWKAITRRRFVRQNP